MSLHNLNLLKTLNLLHNVAHYKQSLNSNPFGEAYDKTKTIDFCLPKMRIQDYFKSENIDDNATKGGYDGNNRHVANRTTGAGHPLALNYRRQMSQEPLKERNKLQNYPLHIPPSR